VTKSTDQGFGPHNPKRQKLIRGPAVRPSVPAAVGRADLKNDLARDKTAFFRHLMTINGFYLK
jgi:hypothetical protein